MRTLAATLVATLAATSAMLQQFSTSSLNAGGYELPRFHTVDLSPHFGGENAAASYQLAERWCGDESPRSHTVDLSPHFGGEDAIAVMGRATERQQAHLVCSAT